jgi:hypothetical protein
VELLSFLPAHRQAYTLAGTFHITRRKKTEREKGGERKFFYFFSRQERASSFQDGQFLSNME